MIGDAWIQTYTETRFFPFNPRAAEINLTDIAHALSNQCRFSGHTYKFYSVAQHCTIVSRALPPEHAAWGLFHDAAEAYLVDLPTPIKRCLPEYLEAEERILRAVAERFDLSWPMPEEVKLADKRVLATEVASGLIGRPRFTVDAEPLDIKIRPLNPLIARGEFYGRLWEIFNCE